MSNYATSLFDKVFAVFNLIGYYATPTAALPPPPPTQEKVSRRKKDIYVSSPFSPMEANSTHSKCHGLKHVLFYYDPRSSMIKEKSMFEASNELKSISLNSMDNSSGYCHGKDVAFHLDFRPFPLEFLDYHSRVFINFYLLCYAVYCSF